MLDFNVIIQHFPYILGGVGFTLQLTITALLCGLPLGTLIGILSLSKNKYAKAFANVYVSVFRGTPLLVQLMIIFLALPLWGIVLTQFESGALAFALNSAAYTSQSIRAGIQSVDPGQRDAAKVLGLSSYQVMRFIILPQAVRNIFPALINEMVNLLKETAVISVVGGLDLFRRAQVVQSQTFLVFEPYLTVAACYYVMVLILSKFAAFAEHKMRIT